jgi:hypothetical protein
MKKILLCQPPMSQAEVGREESQISRGSIRVQGRVSERTTVHGYSTEGEWRELCRISKLYSKRFQLLSYEGFRLLSTFIKLLIRALLLGFALTYLGIEQSFCIL